MSERDSVNPPLAKRGEVATGEWRPGHLNTMTARDVAKGEAEQMQRHRITSQQWEAIDRLHDQRQKITRDMERSQEEAAMQGRNAAMMKLVRAGGFFDAEEQRDTQHDHEATKSAVRFAESLLNEEMMRDTVPATPEPGTAQWRKQRPLVTGVLHYFPDALLEVANCSYVGNEQHNPGTPLRWDRSKSTDELDAAGRHLLEAGTFDSDGVRHSAKLAWRALANLQKELEAERKAKAA